MTRIPQSQSELESHLQEQLEFLAASADSYDRGFEGESKRMATAIRILLHDTGSSISLLGQLGVKGRRFHDSAAHAADIFKVGRRIGSYTPLAGVGAGASGVYIPYLDDTPPGFADFVPLTDFWNRVVFVDNGGASLTRRDIVLAVANQDGGAHVDPELDERYHRLTRMNSMGWEVTVDGMKWPLGKVELAALRQIAHEVLRTLVPTYLKKKMLFHSAPAVFAPMILVAKKPPVIPTVKEIGRNDPCPCESGLKYKRCHGNAP